MSNRLPETELANWSFLPVADKRRALIAFEGPKNIKGSYEPFRKVFPDAINQQFPLFGEGLGESNWEAIERRLFQECKGDQKLIEMNKGILWATHRYCAENGIAANEVDVVPLKIPGAASYSFGLDLIVRYRGHASIVFLNMRRTSGLNPNGRRFIFSAMHHRFREAYPDLTEAELEIWHYRNNADRTLVCHTAVNANIPFDDMVADIVETHQIWESVKRGGEDLRRAVGGGAGPLFD